MSPEKKYPEWICHDCGTRYCKGDGNSDATYHLGFCDCCGAIDVPVTQPRDYGHFKQWPLPSEIDPDPLPETVADLVDKVMRRFDFEQVHKAMQLLDWRWNLPRGFDVPTLQEIKDYARAWLIMVVPKKVDTFVGSGGFYAHRHENGLELQFVLQKWSAFLEDYDDRKA